MKRSIPAAHQSRYFFHFTHIDNLKSILKHGLLCTNEKERLKIQHIDIAAATIQERRKTMDVSCGPGGKVHDYVPFYFTAVNPMFLSLINSKNIDQERILYFAISIDKLKKKNCVFTNASANTAVPPTFYDHPENLDKLDWGAIDSLKWKCAGGSEEMHRRMAEVLIHRALSVDEIDYMIVWNNDTMNEVKLIYQKTNAKLPQFSFSPFKGKYKVHFTKFMVKGGDLHSLVTGPVELFNRFTGTIKKITKKRAAFANKIFLFRDLSDCLSQLKKNFCAIKELEDIYELETINEVHQENVSDHTLKVVKNLESLDYYKSLNKTNKDILKLSAYLHDIGKGPKSKWPNGKQPAYPDHPADAPQMLERILVEDFENLTEYELRKVCLLVTYHDLIGEIIAKGRDIKQLVNIIEERTELEMLDALNFADVKAIDSSWALAYGIANRKIKNVILEELEVK